MILLEFLIYLCVAVCGVGVIRKIYQYVNTPVHLRWELYPVAHEAGEKVCYGGSYFEDVDWWKCPRKPSLIGELKGMIPEMLFVKALYEHNRPLWCRSFPFHFGLYLLIGFAGLIITGAFLNLIGLPVAWASPSSLGRPVYILTILVGIPGMLLTLIGSAALFHRRMIDLDIKDFTYFSHYFNLGFIFATVFFVFLAWLLSDRGFSGLRNFVAGLVPFVPLQPPGFLISVEALFTSLLVAYIPFTNLSHPIAKYFTYHKVRWDDEPNLPGSAMEKRIGEYLNYPVTWSAPHLQGEGARTWAKIATEEIKKDEKR